MHTVFLLWIDSHILIVGCELLGSVFHINRTSEYCVCGVECVNTSDISVVQLTCASAASEEVL